MKIHISLISILLVLLLQGCTGSAELSETKQADTNSFHSYTSLLTTDYLRSHLEVIAHDSLRGRNTGTVEEQKAARYIIEQYEEMGVAPKGTGQNSYKQPFMLNAERVDSLVFHTYKTEESGDSLYKKSVISRDNPGDYIRLFGGAEPHSGEIVFGGFGINDARRGVQHLDAEMMQNHWVLIFSEYPTVVDGDTLINPEITNNSRIGAILGQYGAGGVLVVSDDPPTDFDEAADLNARLLGQPENMRLQYLDDSQGQRGFPKSYTEINPRLAAEILGLQSADELSDLRTELTSSISDFSPRPTSFRLDYTPYDGTTEVEANNVVAYIEGSDPELKDEAIVLMAHYDHIGLSAPDDTGDMINNGADDNGSGTVGLMAIAEMIQNAKDDGLGLDRSLIFLHVSAEEKGLLGSRYYSDHPVHPVDQTVTAFNADMIGRSDTENSEAGTTNYVYLIGGEIISSELDSLVSAANDQSVSMRLDRKYNDLTDSNQFYRRSDHWNLGRLNVPFVFFFTGLHEDYHRPGDEIHDIEFEKYARVIELIYRSTIEVANYDGRPEVDNEMFINITREMPR